MKTPAPPRASRLVEWWCRARPELTDVRPFRIEVEEEALADLRRRLAATRWTDEVAGAGWDYGTSLGYLQELCPYWLEEFDWRAQEAKLNAFDHYLGSVAGLELHFIHARCGRADALPLIATHGWPSTFFELLSFVPRLTGSERGEAAFDLVVPSMPAGGHFAALEQPDRLAFDIRRFFGALAGS